MCQPFPQTSPGVYQIPSARLNAQSLLFLNAVAPLPNNPAAGFLNYINTTPTINNTRDDEIKVDYNFTSKLRLMAEYLDSHQTNNSATQTFTIKYAFQHNHSADYHTQPVGSGPAHPDHFVFPGQHHQCQHEQLYCKSGRGEAW